MKIRIYDRQANKIYESGKRLDGYLEDSLSELFSRKEYGELWDVELDSHNEPELQDTLQLKPYYIIHPTISKKPFYKKTFLYGDNILIIRREQAMYPFELYLEFPLSSKDPLDQFLEEEGCMFSEDGNYIVMFGDAGERFYNIKSRLVKSPTITQFPRKGLDK